MARGRSNGRRTDYTWVGDAFAFTGLAGAKQIQQIATANLAATVTRCRGELLYALETAAAAFSEKVLGFGLIVASDDQVAAGVGAFPGPLTDMDADFLWHGFGPLATLTTTVGDVQTASGRLTVDSKAMRRIKQNENVVLVIEGENIGGTETAFVVGGIRVLFGT